MSPIVYYVVFMVVDDFAAYLLGLITEVARKPPRLSCSLFSFPLGVLGACCAGDQTQNAVTHQQYQGEEYSMRGWRD
jgi:hypothetical protein